MHKDSEFMKWLVLQPKNETGKVDGRLLIEESKRRGYCVCPRQIREMISFAGLRCKWCEMIETDMSWKFYYAPTETDGDK